MTLPAFQAVLDRHAAEVHRYLVGLVGVADAEDCLQETFVAALRAYDSLSAGSNVRGWLFTIANRKAIDFVRASARRGRGLPSPTTVVDTADRVENEDLWTAVARLPDKQRQAVVHRFVADLPYAEVGELLGCSEAAARQNVRQALVRLRQEMNRDE